MSNKRLDDILRKLEQLPSEEFKKLHREVLEKTKDKKWVPLPGPQDYWSLYACTVKAEKLDMDDYTPPSDDERKAFADKKEAKKKAIPTARKWSYNGIWSMR